MAYKSRNRSPYQTKMPGVNNGQIMKRKVSGYQKPTQGKRGRQTKRINELAFQNHQNDLKRYSPSMSSKQNPNHLVYYHRSLPISESGSFVSLHQNGPRSTEIQGTSSYFTNNSNVPRNMSQQPLHQMWKSPSYNTGFILDSSSSKSNFTTPFHNYFHSNGIQSHPTKVYSDYPRTIHGPIPTVAESGFQINEETNKLLLSLDRNLINLVSGKNSDIPPPKLTDNASLKLRRQNVIDALYNKEDKQCPNCGLRFSKDEKESFEAHLDEHFRKNSERKRVNLGELRNQRKWYPNFAKIKSSESQDNNYEKKKEKDKKIPMIAIDKIILGINKDIVKCNLCHEEFEQVYIDDQDLLYKTNLLQERLKDGWYLKNAVWTGSSDVVHPTCLNE